MAIHTQDLLEDGSWQNETKVQGREWVLRGGERLARDVFLLAQQGLSAGLTGLSAHLRGKDLLAFQRECANLHNTHMKGTLGVEGYGYFYGSLDVVFQQSKLSWVSTYSLVWIRIG